MTNQILWPILQQWLNKHDVKETLLLSSRPIVCFGAFLPKEEVNAGGVGGELAKKSYHSCDYGMLQRTVNAGQLPCVNNGVTCSQLELWNRVKSTLGGMSIIILNGCQLTSCKSSVTCTCFLCAIFLDKMFISYKENYIRTMSGFGWICSCRAKLSLSFSRHQA